MSSQPYIDTYYQEAKELLSQLIATPSISREEQDTARLIEGYFSQKNILFRRKGNNIWAKNRHFTPSKPTVLLNSHHDTVRPNSGYTRDPYTPTIEDGKLYGLGSNDAGGCLVCLIMTFLHFYDRTDMPFNLIMAATAEEENSGSNGVESILQELAPVYFGMIGEPTEMQMGVAEKGLMVLDCYARGEAGHAARDLGENAIYKAVDDITMIRNFTFEKVSKYLGPVKLTTTMIEAGYQHNVIPDKCHFVIDVRTTDVYTNREVYEIISQHMKSEVKARSFRLNSSHLPEDMPVSIVADKLGITKFGSPTSSDQAVMDFPTFKMGPGRSERSHTADEFIYLEEIKGGIAGYIRLLDRLTRPAL